MFPDKAPISSVIFIVSSETEYKKIKTCTTQVTLPQVSFLGYEGIAAGAITTTFQSETVDAFNEHISGLTPENKTGYSWFGEYWQDLFTCDIPG